MSETDRSIVILLIVGAAVLLSFMQTSTHASEPSVRPNKIYVSTVKGPKPYPEGAPWKWSDLKSQAIESKDRPQDPWIMGPTGATHPVVLFEASDIPKIRERLKRGAGPRLLQQLLRNAEGGEIQRAIDEGASPQRMHFVRMFAAGRQIRAAGLYSTLTGDVTYAERAIPLLLAKAAQPPDKRRILNNGRRIGDIALGYDMLYKFMTPEQRQKVRTGLDVMAREMFLYRVVHSEGNWLGNNQAYLGIAGFALSQENRYAESWILRARQAMLIYFHNTFDPEGADYEAMSRYLAMGLDPMLAFCAFERRQGRDFFTYRNNLLEGLVEFSAYMLVPNRTAFVAFDDAFVNHVNFPGLYATIAGLTGDPLAQGVFEATYPEPRDHVGNAVMAALFYDPDLPAEKMENSKRLPLGRAYRGFRGPHEGDSSSGHVFLRTGFDSEEDILFAAQCGDNGGWHGHADQSSFYLYAYGDVLVLDPAIIGSYGEPLCEWMKGPEAHSLVMIDAHKTPDSAGRRRRRRSQGYFRRGEVDGFIHTESLDFISMDMVKGLVVEPGSKSAERGKRYVLFFRHPNRTGYFVIVDDVIGDASPRRYEWLLQPDPMHKVVKEGPGKFAFTGNVDLKIRVLEPQDPAHRLATFKEYGVDYLRVRSKEDRPRGLFFTILYPKKKDMKMPAITEIRTGSVIGAKIGEDIVLFNRKRGGTMDASGVTSDGELVGLRISAGTVRKAVVLGGSSLTLNGKPISFEKPGPRKFE